MLIHNGRMQLIKKLEELKRHEEVSLFNIGPNLTHTLLYLPL